MPLSPTGEPRPAAAKLTQVTRNRQLSTDLYTDEGHDLKERMWQETMEDLKADSLSAVLGRLER